ncbi:ImmA/IrrE family metallo-endopeptidase [Aureibacillus halotolerans]|uniref:Uncharacterized protein DUF955 n=1 Tax=Aureibacillus halotolerans TaxID=1508390 RepID=A0A4R6TYE5_9BACI|nr:ImmA/IrrE family metallo-endopeptidase [Aureibacillus halotolerans]TDQ35235.1 uncharacterized protein DUF955 [Aureibacillus halotolerans]
MWIKERVNLLINRYRTNNPFEIASEQKISVVKQDMHEEIMGFYKYIRRAQYIFVNSNLNCAEQTFTCAHELGHSQLHREINTPFLRHKTLYSVDKVEQEANMFAVELLMHDEELYKLGDTALTISDAATLYGVPREIAHLKKY